MSEDIRKRNPEVNESELKNVDGGAMQPGLQIQPVQVPQPLDQDSELARTADQDRLQRTDSTVRVRRAKEPDKLWW